MPTAGGDVVNLTTTPDIRESQILIAPDGRSIAFSIKPKDHGQEDLAVIDPPRARSAC